MITESLAQPLSFMLFQWTDNKHLDHHDEDDDDNQNADGDHHDDPNDDPLFIEDDDDNNHDNDIDLFLIGNDDGAENDVGHYPTNQQSDHCGDNHHEHDHDNYNNHDE